jgi:DivIVA domain-containing protein
MGQLLLFIVVALVVAAIVFGVTVMMSGGDSALTPVEPDGRAVPLPSDRPLGEDDITHTQFDTAWRGYRMAQVDQALQRAAYDIGYKGELISVLEAEVIALREGRTADADALRRAREAAIAPIEAATAEPVIEIDASPADASPAGASPAGVTSVKSAIPNPTPAEVTPAGKAPDRAPAETAPADKPAADGPLVEVSAVPPEDRPGESDAKESEPVERR